MRADETSDLADAPERSTSSSTARSKTRRKHAAVHEHVPQGKPLTRLLTALRAAGDGDFSVSLPTDGNAEMVAVARAFNRLMHKNQQAVDELVRVGRSVGREGKMRDRATVEGLQGQWAVGQEAVNTLISDLVQPTFEVSRVIKAVAEGDLSQKVELEIDGKQVQGEFFRIGSTVNRMVDQLNSFASEVTRVSREVGTEGVLGGQANVPEVGGTWKDLTDSVNAMASNLTNQVRNIALVTTAVANGDLSQKITVEARGEVLELKNTINKMVDQLSGFAAEVTRVAREVGTEGVLGGQATVSGVAGTWKDLTQNVNAMAGNLTVQVRNIADVTTAVARGDLSRKITVDAQGEILELKDTVNAMVDQLNAFASEVTRVAREVGTEGKLGGQAKVTGAAGVWRDLTDNVNGLAANLTTQVRNIADVTTAVANGDLSQKITAEAQGEVLSLKNTINNMVDRLRVFGDEVSRVAKEVGTEGKLGGQAEVPNVSGTWRNLTDSVNAMANSLTVQVRSIADVTTAVTKGDLTRQITVNARGELDELKQNMNQMISNLRETTERNQEQDWLKTNLAKFTQMLQGQKNLESVSRLIMSELTPLVSAHHGAFFMMEQDGETPVLKLIASYAYRTRRQVSTQFALGEGLVGQAALEKQQILLQDVPENYIEISSGLGSAPPRNIIVLPILFEGEVKAVIELASFLPFSEIHRSFLDQLSASLGVVLNMIQTSMRTEELLEQSQKLTQELQSSSTELQDQQAELKRKNAELEEQTRTVEASRIALEEKAEQLALSSKYKSEFLANMSHELRTPLNSLLLLAKLLSENKEGTLTEKQVEFARTIYTSGNDLLALINDILDIAKVEAGRMEVEPSDVPLRELTEGLERSFRQVAEQKGLKFSVHLSDDLPQTLRTDRQRLEQVMKNLLSNAIKFTEKGEVSLDVHRADPTQAFASTSLTEAERNRIDEGGGVIAFAVSDTGIGIPKDKWQLIFEAFQQADGTTNRRFGGTGLGLNISREMASLLGGEIGLQSEPGRGSTFTLYLPVTYKPPETPKASPPSKPSAPTDAGAEPPAIEREALRRPKPEQPSPAKPRTEGEGEEEGREANAEEAPGARAERRREPRPEEAQAEPRPEPREAEPQGVEAEAQPREARRRPREARPKAAAEGEGEVKSEGEPPAPEEMRKGPITRPEPVPTLSGRHILVVDDDVRNIFSLTSVLEDRGMQVSFAENGQDAITLLESTPDIDLVLMDVMMPGMDGYETMRAIRKKERFRELPIVALTAKAMQGDREKSIEAGASAYVSKPVDPEVLTKVMSEWLSH